MTNPETKNYNDSPIGLEEELLELKDGIEGDEKTKNKEKQEIKEQYPYRTDEDVDARYEIEHMEYRSADIMEDLHSGTHPSEALKNYRAKLGKINNGIITYHTNKEGDTDGYTFTEKYDNYGRIISRVTKFDTVEERNSTSTYMYNSDGSYSVVTNENGDRYEYHYDTHGKLVSQVYNGEAPIDYSKQKIEGDYIGF